MKRPACAVDCPACDGWIVGTAFLCPQCTARVHAHAPEMYAICLAHGGAARWPEYHYWRGMITGTAKLLHGRPKR